MISLEEAEALGVQAYALLEEENWTDAIKIGNQLITEGYESGYRVVATVHEYKEDWNEAVFTLEQAIKVHPNVWELNLHLGTLHMQMGDFEQAGTQFDKALEQEAVEKHWIDLNRSVLMFQNGQVDEALNTLQQISTEELAIQAFELKLQILHKVQRHDLVLELANEELEELPDIQNDEQAGLMGRIMLYIALALNEGDTPDIKAIKHYLAYVFHYDRENEEALELWREVWSLEAEMALYSDSASLMGLLIQGELQSESQPQPQIFYSSYAVIAETDEEALEIVKAFETEADPDSLAIMEVENMDEEGEDLSDMMKGLYRVGPLGFFSE